jgi:hypothetical protein
VKFSNSIKYGGGSVDEDENSWQNLEIKKLESRMAELIVENETLKVRVTKNHYD